MNVARIAAVARKEWRELTRDRIYLLLAFTLPLMMMFLFGWGMSQDVENVKLVILDQDKTAASRDYVGHFTNGKYFKFVGSIESLDQAERLLEDGKIKAAIVIPPRFQERLEEGSPAEVQSIIDGTITLSVRTVRGYIDAISGAASADLQTRFLARQAHLDPRRAEGMMQPLRVQIRYLYNEEIKSIWMIAPELILIIVMWAMPVLMSLSIVREKESGSIYNINASTISRTEFLLGKLMPVVGICLANGFLLWAVAVFYFHAPFRGNPFLFGSALVLYVIGAVSLGMLASIFLQTQQAALLVVIILGAIIATRYSGMFIPLSEMDASSNFIAHLFPPAYFNSIVEGSFLKGAGWSQLGGDFLALAAYPVVVVGLGSALFKKVSVS